jgi:RNA polymerase sigma-70 factor (ECF subfamily)
VSIFVGERKLHDVGPGTARRGPQLSRRTLEGCRAHDPDAFREFVIAHQRGVHALLVRLVGRREQVPDLAQETFLRAYRAFPTFDLDGPAKDSTWVLTIAVRLALNERRRLARNPSSSQSADVADLPDVSTPETERARRELGRAIECAADELSDDQRAVFVLAEYHGMSVAEIARALEAAENTVKTRLFRARAHLRERLAAFAKENIR